MIGIIGCIGLAGRLSAQTLVELTAMECSEPHVRRVRRYGTWRVICQRPGWLATSSLFHTLLVVALILFRPADEQSRVTLQVRLTEDAHPRSQIVEPSPTPLPVVRQKAPPPKAPDPATHQPPPVRVSSSVLMPVVAEKETPVATVSPMHPPSPLTPESPMIATTEPLGDSRGDGNGGRPAEEVGGRGGSGGGGPTGGGSLTKAAVEPASGVFIVSGAGNGMGHVGSGNGGIGSGLGAGRGDGQGEGIGKGAGSGSGAGSGDGAGYGSVHGDGSGASVADLLRSIRHQIEKAKIYPDIARRQGKQGTVELRFRIAANGTVEAVEVVHSSGHQSLDDSSMQTVHRAGPYPPVSGWVRIPLSYRLER
jgi:TonB family protein